MEISEEEKQIAEVLCSLIRQSLESLVEEDAQNNIEESLAKCVEKSLGYMQSEGWIDSYEEV
jgi:benzoyl-CoA reductase/2-hydroxyglutaryl-CoA dehydratase subunit BcrC/BadD/HgdB